MKKILVLDPHRPEFFWGPATRKLNEMQTEFNFVLSRVLPMDLYNFDAIIVVYLGSSLEQISTHTAGIPIIAISMGTDAIVGLASAMDSKRVGHIIAYNDIHRDQIASQAQFSKVVRHHWPTFQELIYKQRKEAKKDEPIRLVNIALHQYSKGLDNLLQMLSECLELAPIELHVLGGVGPYNDYNQYLNYFAGWFATYKMPKDRFKFLPYGEIAPHAIDAHVESIDPHAYITASQGEAGATTVQEGLLKGIPVLVHEHPFLEGLYSDTVPSIRETTGRGAVKKDAASAVGIHTYHNAATLREAISKLLMVPDSVSYRRFAADNFSFELFAKELTDLVKEATQ